MRWAYLIVIVLFVVAIAVFALQNLGMTTMSFRGFSIHAPLAVLAALAHLIASRFELRLDERNQFAVRFQ